MKYLLLFFPFLIIQSCGAQGVAKYPYNQNNHSLLWEVSGKGIEPSYVFGTFHLMCREDIKLSNNVKEIIKGADELYFELDMDDMGAMLGAMLFMKMKNDTTLSDLYTPEEYKKIESYFRDSLQMPISLLKGMKPLLLQALLYPKMMTCKNMSGMEEALVQEAKQYKKEIKGLETVAFQASIFDSIPYKEQATALLKLIDSMQENRNLFDSMLRIYKSQNLTSLDALNNDEFESGNSREILLDNRNRNWVKQLEELMKQKRLFVAVGAGHLTGKNGLIELLRREGYVVKPVQN